MAAKKSPYKGMSIAEVVKAEAGNYAIQLGDDFFSVDGLISFDKEECDFYYDQLLNGLKEMKKSGSDIEKGDAEKCLLLLRVLPFRIQ